MGHSTGSGRSGGRGVPTLTAEERDNLRRIVAEDSGEVNTLNAAMALRQYRIQLRNDADVLDEIYGKRSGERGTPDETVAEFERRVGVERATNTIATLVNRNAGDGRISRYNRSWASEQTGALRDDENTGVSTRMHMAHLDQVATAMRRRNDERAFQSASRAAGDRAREKRRK